MKREKHSAITYLSIVPKDDGGERYYLELERKLATFAPFTKKPTIKGDRYLMGENSDYNVDINVMIRKTIAPFVGREGEIKRLAEELNLDIWLEIVPYIYSSSDEPQPILSLDGDIVEFLFKSAIREDLDYYIM
jgi:hypothetical protein